MDKLIWSIKRAAEIIRWPAPDAWERLEPQKTKLMREWAVAAGACSDKRVLLELMFELGLESEVSSPAQMGTCFAKFLLATKAAPHLDGELQTGALWFYAEGRKRVRFNS